MEGFPTIKRLISVSPWLRFKIRLGCRDSEIRLGGFLSLCSYRRRRAAVQPLWRTRQPVSRCNKVSKTRRRAPGVQDTWRTVWDVLWHGGHA
jgi:hypothetical protein